MSYKYELLHQLDTQEQAIAKQTAIKRDIITLLPDDLHISPIHIHGFGYSCDGNIKFKCGEDNIAQLLNSVPPSIPLVRVLDNSIISFVPQDSVGANIHYKITKIEPLIFKKDGYMDTVIWYTQLGKYVVKIECEVPADTYIQYELYNQRYHGKQVTHFDYHIHTSIPGGLVTRYTRSNNTSYGEVVVAQERKG